MKNKILLVLFVVLGFTSFAFASQTLELKKEKGEVEFLAKGPLVRVNGEGPGAEGLLKIADGKASGTLTLDLESLETGISLRDDHMKNKYLHVKKHPTAKLELTNVELPKDLKGKTKFSGIMHLHGQKKEVSGTAKLKGVKSGKVKIAAEMNIKFSDFNIDLPSFKLVSVGEDVKIKIKTQALVADSSKKAASM